MKLTDQGIELGFKYITGEPVRTGDLVRYNGAMWRVGWYGMAAAFTLISVYDTEDTNYIASSGVPIRDFQWLHSKNDLGNYVQGYNRITRQNEPVELVKAYQ